MSSEPRLERRRTAARRRRRRRLGLLAAVLVAAGGAAFAVLVPRPAGRSHSTTLAATAPRLRGTPRRAGPSTPERWPAGHIPSFPILMYHVINRPPANARFPGLYVAPADFAAQMRALAAAGYRGVTLDQLARHAPVHGRPIVISFDNGYRSQYTQALPVLRRLRWPAVENIQLSGLPPSQGGLLPREVRSLVRAGWELDTQGFNHADLPTLSAAALRHEVADARAEIQRRFHVPVHWFCYPSGHYDATVVAAVAAAGYLGATTVVPGWANGRSDPYRLPRLRVLGGNSAVTLLGLISGTRAAPPAPATYG